MFVIVLVGSLKIAPELFSVPALFRVPRSVLLRAFLDVMVPLASLVITPPVLSISPGPEPISIVPPKLFNIPVFVSEAADSEVIEPELFSVPLLLK